MKLQTGDKITVYGWVMLAGLDEGQYRVAKIGMHYGRETYSFARGKRIVCRHYATSVDAWMRPAGHPDLNRIELQPRLESTADARPH